MWVFLALELVFKIQIEYLGDKRRNNLDAQEAPFEDR